jgi:hypothetical protein
MTGQHNLLPRRGIDGEAKRREPPHHRGSVALPMSRDRGRLDG